MSLYVDQDFVTANGLGVIDPEVQSMGRNYGLTLEGPGSIIRRSIEECGNDLTARFQSFSGILMGLGVSAAHVEAVLYTLTGPTQRPRVMLNNVVVTEPNQTKTYMLRWFEYAACTAVFRAAYHRKLEDKYEKKMLLYREEQNKAWRVIESNGLPVVLQPMAAPGAIREPNSGVWGSENVTAGGSGSTETGQAYDVVITYVSTASATLNGGNYISPTQKNNSEGGPSTRVTIAPAAGQILTVSIASLNPPNGTVSGLIGTADAIYTPMNATGWNVYIGLQDATLYLQNATPIPIATKTWTAPDAPVLSGNPLLAGQAADRNYTWQNTVTRA